MINRIEKKFKLRVVISISSIVIISFITLIGCDSKKLSNEHTENKEIVAEETLEDNKEINSEGVPESDVVISEKMSNNKDNKEIATAIIKKQNDSVKVIKKDDKSMNETKSSDVKYNFMEYIQLLGLSKEKLISTLNENHNSIEEGGLEFKEAGIRVWFDQKNNKQVEQILIMRNDIALNGVKVGDKISRFKEAFGNSVSDKNGDAHFKYKDIFLSVNYDTNTEKTYGVYILKNDF